METRVSNLERIINDLDKVVYGNGKPGLIDKISNLHEEFAVKTTELKKLEQEFKQTVSELKTAIEKNTKENNDTIKWFVVLFVSIASLLKDFIIN